jgi:CRP/FNR family transcriptional regulator
MNGNPHGAAGKELESQQMIEADVLSRIPMLRQLNAAARRELAERGVVRQFAAEEVLWVAGSEPRGLYIILEGEVRVVRAAGSRQHVIHTEGPGGTLGDVPLFEGGAYPATAIAARRTRCLVLGREAIFAAIQQDAQLAFALLERLANRVRQLVDRLNAQVAHNVTARVARHLMARADAAGTGTFTLGSTQASLAEELGTVREVIVRALREIAETGAIRSAGRGRFEVQDPALLRELAG